MLFHPHMSVYIFIYVIIIKLLSFITIINNLTYSSLFSLFIGIFITVNKTIVHVRNSDKFYPFSPPETYIFKYHVASEYCL